MSRRKKFSPSPTKLSNIEYYWLRFNALFYYYFGYITPFVKAKLYDIQEYTERHILPKYRRNKVVQRYVWDTEMWLSLFEARIRLVRPRRAVEKAWKKYR